MKPRLLLLASILLILGLPLGARADSLTLTLDQSTITVAPGTLVVPFFGTISNPSATDTIFLNNPNPTTAWVYLTVDTTPFISAPPDLAPGAGTGEIELFDVDLDPSTPIGSYGGNLFQIQGGADGGNFTAFDDLADATFEVDVQAASSATVPEPGTLLLVFTGLALLAFAVKWGCHDLDGRHLRLRRQPEP